MAGSESEAPAPDELVFDPHALVEAALADRDLRQGAATAGIDDDELVARVTSTATDLMTATPAEEARRAHDIAVTRWVSARAGAYPRPDVGRLTWWILAALTIAAAVATAGITGLPSVGVLAAAVGALAILIAWYRRGRVLEARGADIAHFEVEAARTAAQWQSVVVETGVKPLIRTLVNERAGNRFRRALTVVDPQGLAEVDDPDNEIPTGARARVADLIATTPGASIGVAGPRGSGKSTLIRSFCPVSGEFSESRLAVSVPAPVDYGSREFVLHLFAEVCQVVLGPPAVEELRRPDPFFRTLRTPRAAARAVLGASLAAALASTALVLRGSGAIDDVEPEIIWGGIGLAASLTTGWLAFRRLQRLRWRWRRMHDRSSRLGNPPGFDAPSREERVAALERSARDHLTDIWFQQSFSAGWSGSLELPIGLSGGFESARELARQQMSYPDVVREFRRFLESVPQGTKVIIGIDELDKMAPAAARKFLNDVKVIFGIPRVYYLLSVSEDAMSSFERRGLPLRDVFDSTFDDIVRVGYLDANRTIDLLQRRMIGAPIPFLLLCHALAGGLARDVIRVARAMVAANAETEDDRSLGDIAAALVRSEVRAKAAGALVATRSKSDVALQDWLRGLGSEEVDSGALLARAGQGAAGVSELAVELRTFCLYEATVLEHFATDSPDDRFTTGVKPPGHEGEWTATTPTDDLAAARQALATSPRIAWDLLRAFRDEHLGAATPDFPAADAG